MPDTNPYSSPQSQRHRRPTWIALVRRAGPRFRCVARGAGRLAATVAFITTGGIFFAGVLVGEPRFWQPGTLCGVAAALLAWTADVIRQLSTAPPPLKPRLQENR